MIRLSERGEGISFYYERKRFLISLHDSRQANAIFRSLLNCQDLQVMDTEDPSFQLF